MTPLQSDERDPAILEALFVAYVEHLARHLLPRQRAWFDDRDPKALRESKALEVELARTLVELRHLRIRNGTSGPTCDAGFWYIGALPRICRGCAGCRSDPTDDEVEGGGPV